MVIPALTPAIVLVEPQEQGNVGATARAMANMGLAELVLVRPAQRIGRLARAFAVGAGHVLDSSRTVSTLREALAPYHRIVGTTSARGREAPAALLGPRRLADRLRHEDPETRVAVVFGPEASGLDNDQLSRCGLLVRVRCAPAQPTLNLSQAVLIVAYELYRARLSGAEPSTADPRPASVGELDGLFAHLGSLLDRIGFDRDDTFDGVLRDLRRLAARAGPTPREVKILRGICRRAMNTVDGK